MAHASTVKNNKRITLHGSILYVDSVPHTFPNPTLALDAYRKVLKFR